jgi:hypothetical protein
VRLEGAKAVKVQDRRLMRQGGNAFWALLNTGC